MTERRRPKPSAYHLMSKQEKEAYANRQIRDASVRCPDCEMQLMPADLLTHQAERCQGQPEPGAGAKWVTWREALKLVPKRTLIRWVESGFVRSRGERGDRQYLYRDLAVRVSQLRGFRRR